MFKADGCLLTAPGTGAAPAPAGRRVLGENRVWDIPLTSGDPVCSDQRSFDPWLPGKRVGWSRPEPLPPLFSSPSFPRPQHGPHRDLHELTKGGECVYVPRVEVHPVLSLLGIFQRNRHPPHTHTPSPPAMTLQRHPDADP